MLLQHSAGKGFNFAEGNGLKTARPLKAKAETANAAKQIQDVERHAAKS